MYQSNEAISVKTINGSGVSIGVSVKDAYSYDYVTVETNEKFAIEYVDCYEALGFELVKSIKSIALKTALTFKRDRKIKNKEQLKKVQLKLDEALATVNKYEQNKNKTPLTAAIGLGTAGSLTFGGGMCLCLLNGAITAMIGGITLGLAGLGVAGLGYLAYKKLFAKKSVAMNKLIDSKRDEISALCEEAQKLL